MGVGGNDFLEPVSGVAAFGFALLHHADVHGVGDLLTSCNRTWLPVHLLLRTSSVHARSEDDGNRFARGLLRFRASSTEVQ